jgi:hypothetical protein
MSQNDFLYGLYISACGKPAVELETELVGRCAYVSPFSDLPECRDYLGAWTIEAAEADCAEMEAEFEAALACEVSDVLGYCLLDDGATDIRVTVEGTGEGCGTNKFGCQTFGGGVWEDGESCGGSASEIAVLEDPWPQPELVCRDPLPGEPPGQSEGGQVCTWQMISGATEEGRDFADYADCAVVQRQRPYSPAPPDDRASEPDPRLQDPAYAEELAWVKGQMRSASCGCCHSQLAPEGAAVFDLDSPASLALQFHDLARSSPEDPHLSIFPSTDPPRMIAFFEEELARRGLVPEDFGDVPYGAGPLDAQLAFEPERCSEEEGVSRDGTLRWLPGLARYIYVLEADAVSPTVPPNLDLPDGTLWRLDVPQDGRPVPSESVIYGEVPQGLVQRFPADGAAPEPLVEGQDYYLYVTADVLYPISRCVFTAGEEPRGCGCASTGSALSVAPLLLGLAALRRRHMSRATGGSPWLQRPVPSPSSPERRQA